MQFEVVWSKSASVRLDKIYKYYVQKQFETTAKNIVIGIINELRLLENSLFIGQKEPLLMNRKPEIRYVIYSNYKVLYSVDVDSSIIRVLDVFDTRQNPKKIQRNK